VSYTKVHADWHNIAEGTDTPITAEALEQIETGIFDAAATADAAIAKAILDSKGDAIFATAADTPARVAVGANDTVLIADSAQAAGVKYAKVANAQVDAAAAIAQSKLAFDAVQTYAPTWTGSAVNPAIGNGTITGRYVQIGKMVWLRIKMLAGTTTTFGTGDWRFTLPVAAAAQDAGATATFFDSSASAVYHGLARFNGSLLRAYTNASPAVLVDPTNPFTWATADFCELDLVYEAS